MNVLPHGSSWLSPIGKSIGNTLTDDTMTEWISFSP